MRRILLIVPFLLLVACSDDDASSPDTTASDTAITTEDEAPSPETYGADADAEPITTPEGDTVYLQDDSIYGPCDILDPHKDDLTGWLDIPPPPGHSDFGYVCAH